MDNGNFEKMVRYVIRNDSEYRSRLLRFREMERKFDRTVGELPEEVRDIIWDYVMASNALDDYAITVACRFLEGIR